MAILIISTGTSRVINRVLERPSGVVELGVVVTLEREAIWAFFIPHQLGPRWRCLTRPLQV